jgi:hypothetical protein
MTCCMIAMGCAYADPRRLEGRMTECDAMKRPGKLDTGNPFDEG